MTNRIANAPVIRRDIYDYKAIESIDGRHPIQSEVPGSHVLYRARRRKNGKVAWFNFDLATEMGLIDPSHPRSLLPGLEKSLLETFAIQIINEYDLINGTKIDPNDMKPNFYMATRYLQLQHPGRTGQTSGDGRSIWNGIFKHRGVTWDISSCGTGATCLSPATHKYKKFFRTGDPAISYGCGYSDLDDGVMGAIFSEILHRNGHETERCLAVIEFPGNLSINVRAAKNLWRPSHFFNHLKQGHHGRLKSATDYYIKRELANKAMAPVPMGQSVYRHFLSHVSTTFAEMAARFESDYIFCWLAWDGDNILTNGGIIDYGSVRQFGLFHHEYRFDDVERWSTSITEQKAQARYIVQTFVQMIEFIESGRKKPIDKFKNHLELRRFDKIFYESKQKLLLEKIGFTSKESAVLLQKNQKAVVSFQKSFTWFERKTRQSKKPYRVADGVTRDALYCMRDILRSLPQHLFAKKTTMTAHDFMKAISSSYCRKSDTTVNNIRSKMALQFQDQYQKLIFNLAKEANRNPANILEQIATRSAIINRAERITGDAVCNIGSKILKERKHLTRGEVNGIISSYIEDQVLVPEHRLKNHGSPTTQAPAQTQRTSKILASLMRITKSMREGL
jgi:uncharacterized protein YdiU (UPF0061 family)